MKLSEKAGGGPFLTVHSRGGCGQKGGIPPRRHPTDRPDRTDLTPVFRTSVMGGEYNLTTKVSRGKLRMKYADGFKAARDFGSGGLRGQITEGLGLEQGHPFLTSAPATKFLGQLAQPPASTFFCRSHFSRQMGELNLQYPYCGFQYGYCKFKDSKSPCFQRIPMD